MAYHEISPGNAHSPSRLCPPHIRPCFPCRYRTLKIIDFSSNTTASYVIPVRQASASESLFVRLPACGFLQPTPHDANLGVFATCRPANTSPCRVYRGLAPPSKCALPGAQPKKGRAVSGPALIIFSKIMLKSKDEFFENSLLFLPASFFLFVSAATIFFPLCLSTGVHTFSTFF